MYFQTPTLSLPSYLNIIFRAADLVLLRFFILLTESFIQVVVQVVVLGALVLIVLDHHAWRSLLIITCTVLLIYLIKHKGSTLVIQL